MFEKNLLKGKRVLITGGGSGLGAAMGRRFAELGAELVICGRRLELLEQTASAIRSDSGTSVGMGLRVWENSATGSLLEAVSYPSGDLLRFHELFRSFFDFDQRLTEFTDYSSLAPLVFELRRGEKTAEGVLRISRQCLSEAGPMFL